MDKDWYFCIIDETGKILLLRFYTYVLSSVRDPFPKHLMDSQNYEYSSILMVRWTPDTWSIPPDGLLSAAEIADIHIPEDPKGEAQ